MPSIAERNAYSVPIRSVYRDSTFVRLSDLREKKIEGNWIVCERSCHFTHRKRRAVVAGPWDQLNDSVFLFFCHLGEESGGIVLEVEL